MWEGRSTWSYNTDLILDLAMYTVDFAHHLHMLVSVIILLSSNNSNVQQRYQNPADTVQAMDMLKYFMHAWVTVHVNLP